MFLPGFQLRRTDYALASLRRASSKPIRPIPRRDIVVPESGTAPTLLLFAENENIAWSTPLEFWVVNIQVIFVGVNPLPLTMHAPSIVSCVAVCIMRVEERRLKVKPPTLQRAGVGVDGLNIYGVPIFAWVPAGIAPKAPVLPAVTLLNPALPNTSNQVSTLVAVAKEVVSNLTEPANWMNPVIGVAWAAVTSPPVSTSAAINFLIFISFPYISLIFRSCGCPTARLIATRVPTFPYKM